MKLSVFFSWLMTASFGASIMVCVILILKMILGRRMSARWHYLIWFLPIGRLVLPEVFFSQFSIFNVYEHLSANVRESFSRIRVNSSFDDNPLYSHIWYPSGDYALSVSNSNVDWILKVLLVLWTVGVICTAICVFLYTIKTIKIVRDSKLVCDEGMLKLLEECKKILNIKKNIQLVESPHIKSPALSGILNCSIILPSDINKKLSDNDLKYVFLHELVHHKNKDIFVNLGVSIIEALHWFNPVIGYGFKCMRQDRELACDEAVLELIDCKEYRNYGAAIIKLLENTRLPAYSSKMNMISSKDLIKKRISMISEFRKESVSRRIIGFMLFILLSLVVLTNSSGIAYASLDEAQADMPHNMILEDLSSYFEGYDGSFVMLDVNKDEYCIYNEKGSRERVSPCSTYKIISSLIGLETGVLKSKDTRLPWDGTTYPFQQWNHDHTLATAFAYSVDWYFQKLTMEIGKEKVMAYMKEITYGNNDVSGSGSFWQESSLKISPIEQVEILKKLHAYQLPFSQKSINTVKEIMKAAEYEESTVYGKTGTGIVNGKSINGWYVGYVEKGKQAYIFAVNIQGSDAADGSSARDITMSILKHKKII